MSNLRNLYISQSFFGVVNLENAELSLSSSVGDTQLQDGVGTNLGLIINSGSNTITLDRNVNVSDNLIVSGNAEFKGDVNVSGSFVHTGSIDVLGDITASGNIKATIGNFDTLNTRILHVLEESASVIFSSGSNILGDEETDTQTLIGQVIVSGTLGVEGNSSFTGSLTVSNEISSSTVNGIGNVTIYSASVDNRLDALETDTGSQDQRLDSLEAFTGSQENINSGYNAFTASVTQSITDVSASFEAGQLVQDQRLDSLETFTGSLSTNFVTSGSFNAYTQSTDNRLNNIEIITASIEVEQNVQNNQLSNLEAETASLQVEIDGISNTTGSFATTGSNTFIGNQIFSGSVQGDCSQGNFFNLTNSSASPTHLIATNITGGRTITLRVNKTNTSATFDIDTGSIKFPLGNSYEITTGNNVEDVLTFVSFDNTALYAAAGKNFQ
jgi:hypothetical protein